MGWRCWRGTWLLLQTPSSSGSNAPAQTCARQSVRQLNASAIRYLSPRNDSFNIGTPWTKNDVIAGKQMVSVVCVKHTGGVGARLADARLAEARLAEERLAEARLAEERLAEERLAEARLAEAQRGLALPRAQR
ncbi:unnamed protein product [Arctogadus glacialis]